MVGAMVALIFGDFSKTLDTNGLPDIQLFFSYSVSCLTAANCVFLSCSLICHSLPSSQGSWSPFQEVLGPASILTCFPSVFSVTVFSIRFYAKIFDSLYRFLCE